MLFNNKIPSQHFSLWLFKTKENKVLLLASSISIIISFIWFKYIYPYPNFFPDSYQYIAAAIENRSIDYRPIGYTKFIKLIRVISSSHIFLVLIQYLMLQISVLYLLFTINYLLGVGKWVFRVLILCCIINPLLPHLSNFVSSDPLFTSLSLLWLTQLLWIIYRPTLGLVLSHALLLFMAFIVRYNALYYPAISIAIVLFAKTSLRIKSISLTSIGILLSLYIAFTQNQFKKMTGIVQFAPFSGWQLVANGLEAYSHTSLYPPVTVPSRFKKLHTLVNDYLDSLGKVNHRPEIETAPYYMWGDKSPILRYAGIANTQNINFDFQRWAAIAPFYTDYARLLIRRHPGLYIKYNIGSNLLFYIQPFTEYLGIYNTGKNNIHPLGVYWFQLKTNELKTYHKNSQIKITQVISSCNGFINLVLVLSFTCFMCIGGLTKCNAHSKSILIWMLIIWGGAMGFSILTSPIALRYQVFQIIITFILAVLLIAYIVQEYKTMCSTKTSPTV